MAFVRNVADRVILLDGGVIIKEATPEYVFDLAFWHRKIFNNLILHLQYLASFDIISKVLNDKTNKEWAKVHSSYLPFMVRIRISKARIGD
ncbi:MAG: hypothetical protein GX757_03285 [Clostridiales bacterium]|nr:hypothetical protein [Clostridiales bacterium]